MLKPPNGWTPTSAPGALAVQVEVADGELALAALEPLAHPRVERAGQAVLRVVRDARCPRRSPDRQHRQHRAEDLLAGEARLRLDPVDDRRLTK